MHKTTFKFTKIPVNIIEANTLRSESGIFFSPDLLDIEVTMSGSGLNGSAQLVDANFITVFLQGMVETWFENNILLWSQHPEALSFRNAMMGTGELDGTMRIITLPVNPTLDNLAVVVASLAKMFLTKVTFRDAEAGDLGVSEVRVSSNSRDLEAVVAKSAGGGWGEDGDLPFINLGYADFSKAVEDTAYNPPGFGWHDLFSTAYEVDCPVPEKCPRPDEV